MDLSEALKFTPIASFAGDASSGSSITAVNRNNKSGCTYTCSNRNHNALFHYSSALRSVCLYDTRSRDIQSQYEAQNVLHIACSDDARILLLVHADGSISCIDVTRSEMKLRWCMEHVHSHTLKYGVDRGDSVGRRRFKANAHRGPVHSVKFQKNSYHAFIADAVEGLIVIDCQAGKVVRRVSSEGRGTRASDVDMPVRITCADWSLSACNSHDDSAVNPSEMIIGYDDGSIGFVNIENQITKIVPDFVQAENDNDDEMACWSCTHVDCFEENYIAIGMCRVSLPDGIEDDDCVEHSSDLEVESDEDDDCADHEVMLLIYDRNKQKWTELGDVVPFFNIPKFARHVFFTTYLPKQRLLLVACNVSGDIAVVAKNGEEEEWQVCELQEGNAAMAPVAENDEFLVPTGVNWIVDGDGKVDFVLSSSGGSISVFQLEHCTDETFGSIAQFKELEWSIQDHPVEAVKASVHDETTTETRAINAVDASLPKVASAATPLSDTKSTFGAQTLATNSFGGSLGGGISNVFGQTSSLGVSSSPFAVNSSVEEKEPALSFGSPVFGLSSAKPGEFSLTPTIANNNTVTQELSTTEKNAPIFGSALKVTAGNTFGNISSSLTAENKFNSAPPIGFASLAASAKENKDFGTAADIKASVDSYGASLRTTDSKNGKLVGEVRSVNSFSESESSETSAEVQSTAKLSDTGSLGNLKGNNSLDQLTAEGQLAARTFDQFDHDKNGTIPTGNLQSLLDEIGEGFHGDELDKQLVLLDPSSSGFIDRSTFISWYCRLGEVSDHDGSSLDSDEKNEREEERAKAMNAFESVATDGVLQKSEFGKLMEQMGTTYCEEEHRRTVRKISDSHGNISKESFVNWYMDWLFGDGDESETSEQPESDLNNDSFTEMSKTESLVKGWGDTFTVDKDSWKCNVCMLLNKGSVTKCVACENIRPGHEHEERGEAQPSEQGKVDGKFLFSAEGTGNAKGFSFGFTPTAEESKDETRGSGITFGFSSPLDVSKVGSKSGISFGFDSKQNNKDTSLQSEEPIRLSDSLGEIKSTIASAFSPMATTTPTPFGSSTETKKSSAASAFPLVGTKAPSPFGSSAVKADAAIGGVEADAENIPNAETSFPPMAMKAPTPFGSSTETKKSSTASAFPPMGTKAPTPFGSSTETKKSSAASAFPPMAVKAPTPFGSSTETQKSSTASAFPPMAMKAPTPFGPSTETQKSITASAFPPIAVKAPTPFGSSTETKKSSTASAFPPMPVKAPTPFGSSTETKKSSTSSAFSAIAMKVPTPFGSSTETKKSSAASAVPPMAMKAPTPFGSSTETQKSSTPSAFPPMAMKAPTPFGSSTETKKSSTASAFPPMGTTAPTPFGSSTEAKKSSAASAVPPMAMKAPTPFGSSTETKKSSTASAFSAIAMEAPTPFGSSTETKKSSTSSAFPPMAMKAPTPFGSSIETKKSSTASAFPPIAGKAPTPFGSSAETKKSSTASAFPPMAMKAPTPFGPSTETKMSSTSSAFPPMGTTAPTPFGSSFLKVDAASGGVGADSKKSSTSSAFPPMAVKAPTPFGSSAVKPDVSSSNNEVGPDSMKSSTASAFSPMGTKAPTPFGSSAVKVDIVDRGNQVAESKLSTSSSTDICAPYAYSSEYESHFWTLLDDWQTSLKDIDNCTQNLNPKEAFNCDQKCFDLIEELSFNLSILHGQTHDLKVSSLLLLSLRDDIDRQIEESKEIINVHFEKDSDVISKVSKWKSLDIESEKKRRVLISRCLASQKSLARLREKISLLQALVKKPTTTKNAFLPWTPMRIKRFPADKVTTKFVLESLKAGYDRTKTLEDKASMLRGSISTIMNESTNDNCTHSKRTSVRGKSKVTGNSLLSPNSFANSAPSSTTSVLNALQSLKKTYVVSTKSHDYGDNIFDYDRAPPSIKFPSWRAKSRSNLMSTSSSVHILSFDLHTRTNGGTPGNEGKLRAEWYKSDTKGMEETKLELPKSLKLIDAYKAEQQALAPFGVTPEKMSSMKVAIEKEKLKKENTHDIVGKLTVSKQRETTIHSKPISTERGQRSAKLTPAVEKNEDLKNVSSKGSTVSLFNAKSHEVKKEDDSKSLTLPQMHSKPLTAINLVGEPRPTSDSNIFAGMKQIEKSLDVSNQKQTSSNSFSFKSFLQEKDNRNYELILSNFYKMHNASKLNEVQKTLEKYKGHETALFEKLSRKYNVPNPLETDNATSSGIESFSRGLGAPLHPPQNDSTKPGGSAQRIAAASFKSTELTSTVAPFGATPMSSFSASPTTATNSPFGSTSSSTPGFGNSPSTPFGQKTSTNSAFGQLSQPIASPFGQSSSPMGSSFGNLAGSGCRTFGGKTTREILITFYQQRNPSKISEVDKVLAKYAGNEEHLLRNLAKKYNLDPSYFGLTTTSVPVFGSTSGVGQSQPFGQTNQSSGGTAAFGSSGFASLAQSVQSNTGGFGTVPSTQASNTFSGLSNARYGSSATPFGAPRR